MFPVNIHPSYNDDVKVASIGHYAYSLYSSDYVWKSLNKENHMSLNIVTYVWIKFKKKTRRIPINKTKHFIENVQYKKKCCYIFIEIPSYSDYI